MRTFDRFERGLENAVDSIFSRAFKSEIKPIEIASSIKRAMDDRASVFSRERTVTPNVFEVALSEHDFAKVSEWDEDSVREELVSIAKKHAREQEYTFLGPIIITFEKADDVTRGKLVVRSATRRGAVAPATTRDASPQNPIIDVAGERYILTGAVTVIGRGSQADIQVDDSGVSRLHLELRVTPGGVIATDLGTTNGSFVEGHKIEAATLLDGNTITIGRTRIMFWTSPEPV